jgi:hypothetical protein
VRSIFVPLVGLEQEASLGRLARRGVATSDRAFQAAAILPGQAHGVVRLARHREASRCSLPRGCPQERKDSRYPRRDIAANQSCQNTKGNVYRLWTTKNDVYLSVRALTGVQRVSLHGSGKWRSTFTENHVAKTLSENRQIEQDVGAGKLNKCQPVFGLLRPASAQATSLD